MFFFSMKNLLRFLPAVLLFATAAGECESLDFLIVNGRVVDGLGTPAYRAEVGIKDGEIALIRRPSASPLPAANEVIDATGSIICPGFIDVHTHAENIQSNPYAENFIRMGVTTLVLGNCGGSSLDLKEFFRKLDDITISANVSSLIGHNTVRREAMGGYFNRAPTSTEQLKMNSLVDKAMRDGALGLSTGLIYLPGTFSETKEIVQLAKIASSHGGIYVSHMRNESNQIRSAIDELITIAREADIPAHISHIKLSGNANWGQADEILELINQARSSGLEITQDQYMYTASSTGISQLIPQEAREGTLNDFRKRVDDPAQRAEIIQEMKESLQTSGRTSYAYAVIASYGKNSALNGMNIVQAAQKTLGGSSLDQQIEMIIQIQYNGGAAGVFHSMQEPDLLKFLSHPNTMIAADSSVRVFNSGVPHPRGYGNNSRALARYVRDQNAIRMEEAIRRMTSLPAQTFGLKKRGMLLEGFPADVVLLDPLKVQDNATFESPHQYTTGISRVWVNGVEVVRDGKKTMNRPGIILKR